VKITRRTALEMISALVLVTASVVITLTVSSSSQTTNQVSYLFSQPISGGALTGPNSKDLTLTVHGLRTFLTEFTDQPERQSVVFTAADFYRNWNSGFKNDPPNAVLSITPPDSALPVAVVLELSDPHYYPATNTATYHAIRILKSTVGVPGTHLQLPQWAVSLRQEASSYLDTGNISSFGPGALFIDNGTGGSGGWLIGNGGNGGV
jgi:hypothetical protein